MTVTRTSYEYLTVEETNWLRTDMNTLLTALKTAGVQALNIDTDKIEVLSIAWDQELDGRYISPLLKSWVDEVTSIPQIAKYLTTIYKDKWDKLYAAIGTSYTLLNNYSLSESENTIGNNSNSAANTITEDEKVYAFDSSEASNRGKIETATSVNEIKNDSVSRSLTKSGYNGAPQDMIEKELELRKEIVLNTIRDDIVNELTISIFSIE